MGLIRLDREVLHFGAGAEKLLIGVTSNVLAAPQTAFLARNGKIVATAHQRMQSENDIFMIIERSARAGLEQHLSPFLQLTGVPMEFQPELKVYFDVNGTEPILENEWVIPERVGRLLVTRRELDSSISEEEFTRFRVRNRIPIHGVDFGHDLLSNVGIEGYASLAKGCYVGQEIVARLHYRTKPPLRLDVVGRSTVGPNQKLTSEVWVPEANDHMGFSFLKNTGS